MSTTYNDRPLLLDGGLQTLDDLNDITIWEALNRHGTIVLRNFGADVEAFYAFASRFNRSFLVSPFNDRKSVNQSNELQTVTVGKAGLSLHFEYGASPMRPDLLWFYCRQPSAVGCGGETLVADGAAIFDRLQPANRDALQARRVMYRSFLPVTAFDQLLRKNRVVESSAMEDVMQTLEVSHGFRIVKETNLFVESEFTTAPVILRASDGRAVLCQDIFADAYKHASDQDSTESFSTMVTWDDGQPIAEEMIADIRAVTRSLTRGIKWQSGDFALIDNTRVLHGRNQTTDPDRKVVMLSSYSNRFSLLPPPNPRVS